MKSRLNLPAGVLLFAALALAGIIGIFVFNVGQTVRAQETPALGAPTNLTAGATAQKSIALFWIAPTVAPGVGYMVERSEDGTSGWKEVGTGTTTTYPDTDPDLKLETTYYYRVSTVNTVDLATRTQRSRPSNVASAITGSAVVPEAPTLATPTPKGPERIDLSWTAPEEDGGADITGYRIEYSNSDVTTATEVPADTWMVLVANTMDEEITYTDDGSVAELEADARRWYRVTAINSAGNGMPSVALSAVTTTTAADYSGAPTGLMATAMGAERIDLSWTAPTDDGGDDITGYKIQYADLPDTGIWPTNWGDLVDNTGSTDTTFSDDGDDDRYGASFTPPLIVLRPKTPGSTG